MTDSITVRIDATGDGYKGLPAKVGHMTADVEVCARPDGRKILSFGFPWEYQLGGEYGIDRHRASGKPLCVDIGLGLIVPAHEMERVWAFVDQRLAKETPP